MALKVALIWGAGQTALKMVLSFLSIKITAVYLGPVGLAMVGQFGNFFTLLQAVVGSALNTGVTNLSAQTDDRAQLRRVWGTAMSGSLLLGGAMALLVALASYPIAQWLLKDGAYWPAVVGGAVSVPVVMVGLVLNGAINGRKQISLLGRIGMGGALAGTLVFVPLCYLFGVWGGLFAYSLSTCCVCLVTVIAVYWSRDWHWADFGLCWDSAVARQLLAFFPMLLVHAVAEPIAPLLMRDAMLANLGATSTGFWQAALRLSDMYTLVVTTAVTMFLMPHLASIKDDRQFGRELWRMMLQVAGITALGAGVIYLCRDLVISIVFTREFRPVRDLLAYLFLGNIFKLASWPLRMALVIKLRAKWYILVEIGVALAQIGLTHWWLADLGANAANAAYAVSFGLALVILLYSNKDYLYGLQRQKS
ncbi:oligosaccharide flippase family protein [Pseudoduganella sp. FT93W]|uniref:Oligosaccharide flippase family protein n=1 Tax=Duganella fentianensis TaxID=2692177 RepID=A0A845I4S8_9BURK|nr:O-antigen translocase [Duganella fentianensis]MYN47377.1 oligosaccharide flippase family protein [Duganella fentianensis]